MSINLLNEDIKSNTIFIEIRDLVVNSRNKVYTTVNTEMLNLYWNIGKIIMNIQGGKNRASYGNMILAEISKQLTKEFGKGFSKRNLERMRKFYIYFPIATTVSSYLSWSHYLELIKISDRNKRQFYLKEAVDCKWSVRELQRQRDSLLYERLSLSGNFKKKLDLVEKGHIINRGKDLIKDPFVL